jgi:hypothetical protein
MIVLFILIIIAASITGISYLIQFDVNLNSKKELIIQDGLITELLEKIINNPDSDPIIIHDDGKHITVGRTLIKGDGYEVCFWFPYQVMILSKDFRDRVTDDDWGYDVGYIRRYSKDYALVKKLMKPKPSDIEQKQRQKLNLEK